MKTKLAAFVLTAAALLAQRTVVPLPAASVTRLPAADKRWAVIIGVDEYDDGNISRLRGAANDAHALERVLIRYAGFARDQVTVLATGGPGNIRPTRTNILDRLSRLARQVPKDGLLLVYFSGHGIDRQGRAFLLPADARLTDDAAFLEETSLSINRVRQWIRATGVEQVVLMLDACRNDPQSGRGDAPNPLTKSLTDGFRFDVRNREVSAFATLYATRIGDRAWEYQDKQRGYFSWALEEALSGKAANARGEVTLGAVVRYLQERVPRQVAADLGTSYRQLPFAEVGGYLADDLVLSVVSPEVAVAQPVAPRTDAAEVAFSTIRDSQDPDVWQRFREAFPEHELAKAARFKEEALRKTSAPEPAKTPGEPKYVRIEPGSFMMGCSQEYLCESDEKPPKRQTISSAYFMKETEVTQAEYETVMGNNPSSFKGARERPVEGVSWNDAVAYCEKVGMRLPTAVEWEYAARAGATVEDRRAAYSREAWFEDNSRKSTHEAKGRSPNAWGLYDMLGNVWEWTSSDYDSARKELRGGSWNVGNWSVRDTVRYKFEPAYRSDFIGFRCAGDVTKPGQLSEGTSRPGAQAEAANSGRRTAKDPSDAPGLLLISQKYREERNIGKAREFNDRARNLAPDNLEIAYNEVLILQDEGKADEAIAGLRNIVEATQRKSYTVLEKQNRALVLERLGYLYRSNDQPKQAVATFQELGALDRSFASQVSAQIIETWRLARDYPKATAEAAMAMKRWPEDRPVRMVYANLLADMGKYGESVAGLEKLLDGKRDREIHMQIVQVYEKARNYGEMAKAIDTAGALSTTPDEQETIHFMRGLMLEKTKKFELAEIEFRKLLEINPNSTAALNYLGYMLADRGSRLNEAVEMIQKALQQDPLNGAYLDSLGWAYYKQGKLTEAEQHLNRARKIAPKDAAILDHLGDVYAKQGNLKAAIAQWEISLQWMNEAPPFELDPEEARRIEEKLAGARVRLGNE